MIMTLTRGLHRTAVVALMIAITLAVWFWGNQRHVQAKEDTLAGRILCYINSVSGPPIPRFHVDECPASIPEPPPTPPPACSNNIDDDGDGLIDWNPLDGDPGCTTPLDTNESNAPPPPPPPPPKVENTLLLC